MLNKLLKKYKKQEAKWMFYLKSRYTTEKIEKLEKVARGVCSFLVFVNACTLMINLQAFAKDIERTIKDDSSPLTVVISDENNNGEESETETVKTETIDHFSQEVANLTSNNGLEIEKENVYGTKRLIVLANSDEFANYGAENIVNFDNLYILQYSTEEDTKNAYEQLKTLSEVESVEIDTVMEAESLEENGQNAQTTANDTELKRYLDTINSTKEIKVAVLDTGLKASDKIDTSRIIDSNINLSTTGNKESTADDNGHGTQIAELIAMNSNNQVKIMPIKVANDKGKATVLNVYLGIQKAIEKGANIVNISMNTVVSTQSQILTKAITEASEKGIVFVVSAGNDGEDVRNYTPSNIGSAIVVSAIENDNTFSSYSNFGQTIDYSAYGTYNGKTGTSYSAATVTGIMADMLSKNQEVSGLDKYAIDLGEKGFDAQFGKGFIGLQLNGTKENDSEDNKDDDSNENPGNNENDNNGENTDNKNNNEEENNNPEDEIPPDYFENSIFGAPWKTLSDEKLKQKLEEAEDPQMAIFLQNLSKEDLNLILSKKTILHNEYVSYEYAKDENGNLIVNKEYTDENGEKNKSYKLEEVSNMPYYQYLLGLDFSQMSISKFTATSGYYYLAIDEGRGK